MTELPPGRDRERFPVPKIPQSLKHWEPVGGVAALVAGLVLLGNVVPVASAELAITTAFGNLAAIAGVLAVSMSTLTAIVGGIMWASPHSHHKALGRDMLIGSVVLLVVGSVAVTVMHFLTGLLHLAILKLNAAPH